MRFFSIVTWLIASLMFARSELAFAQQPTASTAPLSATELEAIIAEARQRINTLGFGMEDPAGPPWKSLTRDQLAKLVASPQLVKAPGIVLDQASQRRTGSVRHGQDTWHSQSKLGELGQAQRQGRTQGSGR
jgi:hypothetical protein